MIFSGDQVTNILNQSWQLVIQTVNDQLGAEIVKIARNLISGILDNVPAKYYLIEDLSSYAA
jgi:hypothetical protein